MPRKRKINTKKPDKEKNVAVETSTPSYSHDEINVIKIVLSSQKSEANYTKNFSELKGLYKKLSHERFMNVFFKSLECPMDRDENDEFTTKILNFAAKFIASFGEEPETHPIIRSAFDYFLSINSPQATTRMWICQMVMNIMNAFSIKAEIDDEIFESTIQRMLEFLKDVSPVVRVQAVYALQRLQDPGNQDDDTVKAYIYHLEFDPSPKVRQAILTAIGKKMTVIPAIMERLYDSDEKVRRHVYLQMSSYGVKQYRIKERLEFLECGLFDRSEIVRKVATNIMLPSWIESYERKYDQFVAAIKMDSNNEEMVRFKKIVHIALLEIFKKNKLSDIIGFLNLSTEPEFNKCIPHSNITLEMLIVWKAALKYCEDHVNKSDFRTNHDDALDETQPPDNFLETGDIFPELSVMCDFIEKYIVDFNYKSDKWQNIYFNHSLQTLLEIVHNSDFADVIGREKLKNLLLKILKERFVNEYVVKMAVDLLQDLVDNVEERLELLSSIVNDIILSNSSSELSLISRVDELIKNSNDMDLRLKVTEMKLKIMDLVEEENSSVERKNYAEAQEKTNRLAVANEELVNMLRNISTGAINVSDTSVSNEISGILESYKNTKLTQNEIIKCLQIVYHAITSKGVAALTLNLLDIYKKFIVRQQISNDLTIRIWALKTAAACSMLYESIAKDVYTTLKTQLFKTTNCQIWAISIECIFELIDRYGFEMVCNEIDINRSNLSAVNDKSKRTGRTLYSSTIEDDVDEEEDIIKTCDIMKMMFHIMDSCADNRIYKTLLIGICRIILHGHYSTKEVMSRFILLYFNPATDPELNQILGTFFENLRFKKQQEQLQTALIPTIMTLLKAPADSPLREIKIESILKYIIGSTHPVHCNPGLNLHNTIAIEFLQMIKDNVDQKDVLKLFSKELLELEISDNDASLKTDMLGLIEPIIQEYETSDPKCIVHIVSFKKKLEGTYRAPLPFSSTANTLILNGNGSDVEEEVVSDNEDNIATGEKEIFTADDILDVSVSQVPMKTCEIRLSKPQPTILEEDEDDSDVQNETVINVGNDVDGEHVELAMTQHNDIVIPATPEKDEASTVRLDSIEIPETQAFNELSDEIPASPGADTISQSVANRRTKRHLQVSLSSSQSPKVSSPSRKQLKLSETAKKPSESSTSQRSTRRGVAVPIESPARKKPTTARKITEKPKEATKPAAKSGETSRGTNRLSKQPVAASTPTSRSTGTKKDVPAASVVASKSESIISTRNKAKNEMILSKVQTRKSLNEILSKSPKKSTRQNQSSRSVSERTKEPSGSSKDQPAVRTTKRK